MISKGKIKRETLKKVGKWVSVITITAIITTVINAYLNPITPYLPFLPSEEPLLPIVTSSPSPNPVVNTATTQSIIITAIPDFRPPYSANIVRAIQNQNSYWCYMDLKFELSEGFKFSPITDNLPENFIIEQGYEHKDVMRVSIRDFPSNFTYILSIPVYTMDYDIFAGTEDISISVLDVQRKR